MDKTLSIEIGAQSAVDFVITEAKNRAVIEVSVVLEKTRHLERVDVERVLYGAGFTTGFLAGMAFMLTVNETLDELGYPALVLDDMHSVNAAVTRLLEAGNAR